MHKVRSLLPMLAGLSGMLSAHAAPFDDRVVAYQPGNGFTTEFGTGLGYTNASAALGEPSRQTVDPTPVFGGTFPVDPFGPPYLRSQLVSVGAGGSLMVQFGSPINDQPGHPYGLDFIIFGSAGFVITNGDYTGGGITDGTLLGNNTGVTRVSVSEDNVTFYSLNPVFAPVVDANYPTDGMGDFTQPVNPALGKADFSGKSLAGIRALYSGSGGGTGYDLAWAQNEQGQSVQLASIRFVRVDVLSGHSEIDGFAAVAAIPEPHIWALGLVAAGILGMRRRSAYEERAHPNGPAAGCLRQPGGFGLERGARGPANRQTGGRPHAPICPVTKLLCLWILFWAASGVIEAATFREDFAHDPVANGWQVFGDASLFRWNATNANLEVTWDSSRSNSCFYLPMGTVIAKSDDFQLEFDLLLDQVQGGVNPGKPFAFELAIGLLNRRDAFSERFLRGTGAGSPNLVEFDYFPDTGYGATVWPALVSTSGVFNYNGSSDYTVIELPTGAPLHLVMRYQGSNQTLATTITLDGQPFGPINSVSVSPNFTDYRVDAFAISSYSDNRAGGSILARGSVDNLVVTVPDPPVGDLVGLMRNHLLQVQFSGQTHWLYTLERTADFRSWTDVAATAPGSSQDFTLVDTHAPVGLAFYRVRAERP